MAKVKPVAVFGVKETMAMMQEMKVRMVKDIVRTGTRKSAAIVAKKTKALAKVTNRSAKKLGEKSTGALWRSIGVLPQKSMKANLSGVRRLVGPRKGHQKRFGNEKRTRDPRHYAHLIEKGFFHAKSGKFIPGWHFMRSAADLSIVDVKTTMEIAVALGVERETVKAYAKFGHIPWA